MFRQITTPIIHRKKKWNLKHLTIKEIQKISELKKVRISWRKILREIH